MRQRLVSVGERLPLFAAVTPTASNKPIIGIHRLASFPNCQLNLASPRCNSVVKLKISIPFVNATFRVACTDEKPFRATLRACCLE